MVSAVDICNLALISLGQPTVVAIDPPDTNSLAAKLCGQIYPMLRDEVIRAAPWRRLKTRVELAADPAAPVFGYTTKFAFPADMQRLLDVIVSGNIRVSDYNVEGDFILCNESGPLQIRYIKDSINPDDWDSIMRNAIAYRLAADLAEPLTQDASKKQYAMAKYDMIIKEAKRTSAQEGVPVTVGIPDPWVSIRNSGVPGQFP